MISEIHKMREGSILLDTSVLIASILTGRDDDTIPEECSLLLEHCASVGIHTYIAPETATRLWNVLFSVNKEVQARRVKPEPYFRQPALRMRAFANNSFHLLRITPATLERAVDLWEQTCAEIDPDADIETCVGIEACTALCAFQDILPPPYLVVTANNHYDRLASADVTVLKPSVLKMPPSLPETSIPIDTPTPD